MLPTPERALDPILIPQERTVVPIVPRRALHALFTYARSVPLASTTGVSPRAMRAVLVALVAFLDADS